MKKPKEITKGEWYVASDGLIVTKDDDGTELLIADIDYMGADKSECKANRKAIAQVPNMIDALIEAYEAMQYVNVDLKKDYKTLSKSMKSIEKVLIKSGCEL